MRLALRVKGVQRVRKRLANGKTKFFFYHRATGTPLPADPSKPEFLTAWREAEALLKPKKRTGTLETLIDSFKDSEDWNRLRDSTRAIMTLNLKAVIARYGTLPLEALNDRRIRSRFLQWHSELAVNHKRAADSKLAALQRVLSWAFDRGLIADNPLSKFRRAYKANRADKIWTSDQIEAFKATASGELQLALLMAVETGQRQDDLLNVKWDAFDGTSIRFRQSKTGIEVIVPVTAALKAAIAKNEQRKTALTILTRPDGRPWTKDAFGKAWQAAFVAAGIDDDLHFHDLRGTAVTRLAEASCTIPEICAITGHTLSSATKILETYLSRTKKLATAAITKLERSRNRTKL